MLRLANRLCNLESVHLMKGKTLLSLSPIKMRTYHLTSISLRLPASKHFLVRVSFFLEQIIQ
jgi:hypothetical protein